jgi:hypothetical protein
MASERVSSDLGGDADEELLAALKQRRRQLIGYMIYHEREHQRHVREAEKAKLKLDEVRRLLKAGGGADA